VEDDSIAMTYSGIRGGVYQTDNYQPDQENIYNWSGSSWNYPSKNIHTYNSENQITTSISMNCPLDHGKTMKNRVTLTHQHKKSAVILFKIGLLVIGLIP
jgi:hypothetical protein